MPWNESKVWGMDYESWDCAGGHAHAMASSIGDAECRASRVDICFDFSVPEDFTSDAFVEAYCPMLEDGRNSRGFTIGIRGQRGINTRYIGSQNSDQYIRVYRKDWEDGLLLKMPPTLRVELVAKSQKAAALFDIFQANALVAYRTASTMIHSMTGFAPYGSDRALGSMPKPKPNQFQRLLQFMTVYGPEIADYHAMGIDVGAVAAEMMRPQLERNRFQRYRSKRRKTALQAIPDLLTSIRYALMPWLRPSHVRVEASRVSWLYDAGSW